MKQRPTARYARRAFTLMEILLVLVILVAMAALAAPLFIRQMRDANLRAAAEQVRTEWNKAHIAAMKTGQIQVYRFQPNGRKFKIEPYTAESETADAVGANTFAPPPPPADDKSENSRNQLPEGIKFLEGLTVEEERAKVVEEAMGMGGGGGGAWSQPILFYPDGVSSDAWLVVVDEHNSAIRVELRGLTGLAVLGDITTPDEAQGGESK